MVVCAVVWSALGWSSADPTTHAGRPARAHDVTFPEYTGQEFADLFDGLTPPDTEPLPEPPPITGDRDADARIRAIAEGRGYVLRPRIVAGLEAVGAEAVHRDVADAWRSLVRAAATAGHDLVLVSGFRSIHDQQHIFVDELEAEGIERIGRPYTAEEIEGGDADAAIDDVLRFHSIPGYSKHHTGHAIDLTTAGDDLIDFADTAAFAWISADNYRNAKLHGFVPSYPPGAGRQGPQPERWEYVWVGRRTILCEGVSGFQTGDPSSNEPAAAPTELDQEPSRFVAVVPTRRFDTRSETGPSGPLCAGETLDVKLTGTGGVPETGVTAVVLNVTATRTTGRGHITVWPTGTPPPLVSSLNMVRPSQTVPNLVTVAVGEGGRVSFATSEATHLLADVVGYYERVDAATSGRLRTVEPVRVADTRTVEPPTGAVGPDRTRRFDVLATSGLSPGEVEAAILNVTLARTTGTGWAAVWPADQEWGGTSNLNFDRSGQTVANLVVTPVGEAGDVEILVSGGAADVVVDVVGYFTRGGELSTSGLFVPVTPGRAFDTRTPPAPSGRIGAGDSLTGSLTATTPVPTDARAVVVNQTMTATSGIGYLTTFPTGDDRPEASNLNVSGPAETRANAAVVPLGSNGTVEVYTSTGAHVLADVFGYTTG